MAKNNPHPKDGQAPAPVTQTKAVRFKFKKETPGAWCYEEVAPDGAAQDDKLIGSLYVRKAQVQKKYEALEVAVTFS